jgi:arabinofuranosyltransferase
MQVTSLLWSTVLKINKKTIKEVTPNVWIGLILTGVIVLFLKNALAIQFIQDDAFTSLRYVKNFLNGQGLVFNPGEKVEGYTNFLWVIILSAFGLLGKGIQLENAAQYLSLFFSLVLIVLTYLLSKFISSKENQSKTGIERILYSLIDLLPAVLLAFSTPLLYWGVSGMETTMFASLLLLSIITYMKGNKGKPNYIFIIISILNSLLRPEGVIFFLFIILYDRFIFFQSRSKSAEGKLLNQIINIIFLKELAVYAIVISIYSAFRLIYYGYLLPNTFYAKTEFTFEFIKRGIEYFFTFCRSNLVYGLFLIFPFLTHIFYKDILKHLLIFWLISVWILFTIILGGDVLPIGRFYLPIAPLIFVLFIQSIRQLIDINIVKLGYIKLVVLSIFVIIISFYTVLNFHKQEGEMLNKRSYEAGLVQKMKIYADWMNGKKSQSEHAPVVAMSTIGAFSYFSNAKVIDIVGLTNAYIAHNPEEVKGIDEELPVLWKERHYNARYVLEQEPDYIIFPAGAKPSAFAECALFVQKDFMQNYYPQIFYSEELNQLLPIFTRKPRNIRENNLDYSCGVKFVKHYINANNHFLKMIGLNDNDLLENISKECDSVAFYCPQRKADALTIKGYAFYHAGEYDKAKKYLTEASNIDPYNAISRLYLKSLLVKEGNISGAVALMLQIKKYSPDAIPDFNVNF